MLGIHYQDAQDDDGQTAILYGDDDSSHSPSAPVSGGEAEDNDREEPEENEWEDCRDHGDDRDEHSEQQDSPGDESPELSPLARKGKGKPPVSVKLGKGRTDSRGNVPTKVMQPAAKRKPLPMLPTRAKLPIGASTRI